jgi:hypothetical protein
LGLVFDAAAIGQYLGGADSRSFRPLRRFWHRFLKPKTPILPSLGPGFINESCLFDASLFSYLWGPDAQGRRVPYMVFEGQQIPIANLHIHSKDLARFAS